MLGIFSFLWLWFHDFSLNSISYEKSYQNNEILQLAESANFQDFWSFKKIAWLSEAVAAKPLDLTHLDLWGISKKDLVHIFHLEPCVTLCDQ